MVQVEYLVDTLAASTDGRPYAIPSTSGASSLLDDRSLDSNQQATYFIWLTNRDVKPKTVTLANVGGTAAEWRKLQIPGQMTILAWDGRVMGQDIQAWSPEGGDIVATGHVIVETQT